MRFTNVAIAALAHVEPPEVVTSADIEEHLRPLYERVKLPAGRLELMTGIRERRFWPVDTKPSFISAQAGEKALAKLPAEERGRIDLLIHCGVCRDRLEPSTASYVHGALGLPATTQLFDLSNACLGFMNALVMAAGMIESGQIERALLVSGENGKPLLERTLAQLLDPALTRKQVKPFFANLTIGAGGVAAVLTRKDLAPAGSPLLHSAVAQTDSEANRLCEGDAAGAGGLEMQTDAVALLEAGVALAQRTWTQFKATSGWDEQSPSRIVCHQVGRQHQVKLLEGLGIAPQKDYSTFETLGNAGSVSCPLTLSKGLETGAIAAGDKVALLGIGSGLCCLMLALEC
ncbi:3-oxoacyl-ACP synthase III [Ruficoccus sp. ZRK36]|uniref:3-oxoacyl-ACP synthase III n=1 Tax=Ruficoccus sp. ZRK36 TaxID=2866311 RepID=UPI001C72A6EC|nr:3-oxoacyl-ACP synthase III [Ruficoccus sp. ZRK36]QYY35176.1 3-oxoacyl-ACP synthase III [Ruficoccus sp. ZRK36]